MISLKMRMILRMLSSRKMSKCPSFFVTCPRFLSDLAKDSVAIRNYLAHSLGTMGHGGTDLVLLPQP